MTQNFIKAALAGIYSRAASNMDRVGDPETLHRFVSEAQEAVEEIMSLYRQQQERLQPQQD